MKEIVFLRHGHALGTREARVPSDSLRPLSERGEADVRAAAERLKAGGFSPALIVASPYRRAATTADIAAGIFPPCQRLACPALSDGDAEEAIRTVLEAGLPENAGLLVVGHQPLLGALAGYFCGQDALPLSPAGFARIACPDGPLSPGPANSLKEHYSPPGASF